MKNSFYQKKNKNQWFQSLFFLFKSVRSLFFGFYVMHNFEARGPTDHEAVWTGQTGSH